ncbi:MAG: hypothetical protein Q6K08_02300, partial [Thermostichales cyanobacterium GMQP_bins_62]
LGSLGGIMKLIPGMNKLSDEQLQKGQEQLKHCEAMINSMTREERRNPELVARSTSRKRRIALGSGHKLEDVSKLVSDFQRMRDMMRQMSQGGFPGLPTTTPTRGSQWRGQQSPVVPKKPAAGKPKKAPKKPGKGFR